MALAFAGNGTITGLSVGGLPDGVIQAADLASGVGGKVLQVVSTVKTDTFQSTANSWTDVTGMSVSITPASGTKVLVTCTATIGHRDTYYAYVRLVRDSTAIAVGTASGSREPATWNLSCGSDNYESFSYAMTYLDTHSADGSTAVNYKLQFNSATNSGEVSLNRSYTDSNNAYTGRYASTITAMEIGA